MPLYLIQAEFTAAAKKAMMENPVDRQEAARPLLEALGGTIHQYYFTAGLEAAFAIFEVPDDNAASAVGLAVGGSGGFTSASITHMIAAADAMEIMANAKSAASGYLPVTG